MKMHKTLVIVLITLILSLALIQSTKAQTSSEMQTFFSKEYAGISVKANATQEAIPDKNLTVNIWTNCTAIGVNVEYLTIRVYGFTYGQEKVEKIDLLATTNVVENKALSFRDTGLYNYSVHVPSDVWDATYAELHLKYSIVDSPFEYNPSFSITIVRNIYYEKLKEDFKNLNNTVVQLNQTFWQSFKMNLTVDSLTYLNRTYWMLQQNYTTLQGSLNELDNTRRTVGILAITTIFFVATTIYLVFRRPKQSW